MGPFQEHPYWSQSRLLPTPVRKDYGVAAAQLSRGGLTHQLLNKELQDLAKPTSWKPGYFGQNL